MTRGTPRRNRRGKKRDETREKRGMKSREDEGIEDRWKRRAELSAESPGRKTRHHRKIALSRTHLFSIPFVVAFHPCARHHLCPHSSRDVPRASLFSSVCTGADSSIQQHIYKSVSSVSFVPPGSPDQFSSSSVRTLTRLSVKRAIPRPTKLPHFFRQTDGSTQRVNFEW